MKNEKILNRVVHRPIRCTRKVTFKASWSRAAGTRVGEKEAIPVNEERMSNNEGAKSSPHDIPNALLVYTRDNGTRQVTYVPPKDGKGHKETYVVVEKYVRDGRTSVPSPTVAEHGFQLMVHKTALSKKDFYANPNGIIENTYYKEMTKAVKKLFPEAAEVKPFHHMIRKASAASQSNPKDGKPTLRRQISNVDHAKGTVGQPASVVHCDYTVRNAISLFDSMAEAEHRKGRYAVINLWRNISESSPIQNNHLAMCDARTVVAPDDFVNCDVIYEDHVSETYHLEPGQNFFHEWYYFPNMVKDEVLVFIQYDSNARSKTRYTFHTSMENPAAPKDASPRQSIECRCIAFFPSHEPNTIPAIIYKDGEVIVAVIFKIMESLLYPTLWPKDARKWMSKELYSPNGVRRVVEEMVHGGAKRKEYGLDKASVEERNKIVEKLLSDGNFEATAKSHFPPKK